MTTDVAAIEQWKRARPDREDLPSNIKLRLFLLGEYFAREHDRISNEFGVSGDEMLILFALRRSAPPFALRPADLLRALLVPSGTMTRHLDRLENRKLVTRQPNPNDRRGALIALTKSGTAVADKALRRSAAVSFVNKGLSMISKQDQNALDNFLARLLQSAREAEEELREMAAHVKPN
jgi:DNA-binding MarR family transcriptional regulator